MLTLFAVLLPLSVGVGIIELPGEDDFADEDDLLISSDLPSAWDRMPIHQMSVLLMLGMSIFILFVVYLGGRSKHKRFNDRTIDADNVLSAEFFRTALYRAVFNFLSTCLFQP